MIIDGRTIANHILADLLIRVDELQETYALQPHLAVIRVGDDPAITSYINQKQKKAKEIGALVSVYSFPESVTQAELKKSIDFLQQNGEIHGLILQLPVPKSINYEELILDIHPDKDVDGFRPNSPFTIPVAAAVIKVLEIAYAKELEKRVTEEKETVVANSTFLSWLASKKIVVMGKGKTGGQPVADFMKHYGAEVIIIDSQTTHVADITQKADIIITAVGKPHILTADMIQQDAILVGIGMSMDENGKFVGDYNEDDIKDKASCYTPIPGGVGPVNVACLLENLVIAAENSVQS